MRKYYLYFIFYRTQFISPCDTKNNQFTNIVVHNLPPGSLKMHQSNSNLGQHILSPAELMKWMICSSNSLNSLATVGWPHGAHIGWCSLFAQLSSIFFLLHSFSRSLKMMIKKKNHITSNATWNFAIVRRKKQASDLQDCILFLYCNKQPILFSSQMFVPSLVTGKSIRLLLAIR